MNFPADIFSDFPELRPGEVWLVGAGPSDPRLLTVMAIHALQSADTIIHDALLDPRILKLAKEGTKLIDAGKRGGKPSPHQTDINVTIIAEAKAGQRVVRLKGGDPFVFGRGGEEAKALVREQIPFRVVPGLSSGLVAPAVSGIPATTRQTNHAVILATGHRAVDEQATRDWEQLAALGQPIILYMALTHLADIVAAFLRGGLAPDTPVAMIMNATRDNERVVTSTLGTTVHDAEAHEVASPAILVVGANAALRDTLYPGMLRP